MPAPVKVAFQVDLSALEAGFKTAAARAKALNAQIANDTVKAAQKSSKAHQASAKDTSKAFADLSNMLKKAANDIEKAQTKSADNASKAQIKAADNTSKKELKSFDERLKAAQNLAKQKKKIAEEEERNIERIAKANKRAAAALQAESLRSNRAFAHGAAGIFGRAGRSIMGTVSGVVGGLGAAAGTAMMGNALWENVGLREQAAALVNATRQGKHGGATQSASDLIESAQGVAKTTGFGAQDVMAAMGSVAAKAGGAKGLQAFQSDLDDLAKTAIAAGVSIQDMGGVFAAAFNAGVKPGEEMRQLMQDFVAMGKEGAIEFKDLASQLPMLAGAGKMFGSGSGMMREAVAMSQFAVKQQVGPEESRTAVMHMIQELAMKSDVLQKSGINAIDSKTGKLRSPVELMAEAMQAAYDPSRGIKFGKETKHGPGALATLFGARGMAMTNVMTDTFMNAGKGEAGKNAVVAEIRNMQAATMAKSERDAAYATMMRQPGAQMRMGMEEFKAEVGKMLPEFVKLLPAVMEVTRAFAKLAGFVSKNPLAGLGALFAANMAAELAKVGFSKVFESALTSAMTARGGMAGGGVGGGMSAGGKAMLGLTIAAAAVSIVAAGVSIINQSAEKGATVGKEFFAASMHAENTVRNLKGYLDAEASFQGPTLQHLMDPNSPEAIAERQAKDQKKAELIAQAQEAQSRLGKATTAYNESTSPTTGDYLNPTKSAVLEKQKAEEDAAGSTTERAKETDAALGLFISAVKNAAGQLGNLPNQSGAPTSRTPTSPLMK